MSRSTAQDRALWILIGAAGAILAQQAFRRARARQKQGDSSSSVATTESQPQTVPAELELELFSRNIGFFGEAGYAAIRDSLIIVVGLGGVGSHAAHMLARSGVKRLRLIDFDQVKAAILCGACQS